MHNLTYTERARIAYANGNDELANALEQLAELAAENERLIEKIWEIEQELAELREKNGQLVDELALVETENSELRAQL